MSKSAASCRVAIGMCSAEAEVQVDDLLDAYLLDAFGEDAVHAQCEI